MKVDGQDYTHEIRLTHSDDMMTQVAFCLLSPDEVVSDYEKDVMYFDMSGFKGEKWIYAFGRTNYNALVIDCVKVTLGNVSGDVNGDGKTNGTDIQAVINVIVDEDYVEEADVNKDGKVNGTDIQEIINIIVEEE